MAAAAGSADVDIYIYIYIYIYMPAPPHGIVQTCIDLYIELYRIV